MTCVFGRLYNNLNKKIWNINHQNEWLNRVDIMHICIGITDQNPFERANRIFAEWRKPIVCPEYWKLINHSSACFLQLYKAVSRKASVIGPDLKVRDV